VQFVYTEGVVVSAVLPKLGPVTGATVVTVYGSGFSKADSSATCSFGGTATHASVNSDNSLTCISPPSSTSTVNLEVSLNGGEFSLSLRSP